MSDTLDGVRHAAEALLAEGSADPGSVWRSPALVTIGAAAMPQARTVVLRRFDAARRVVETHTDTRSAKYRELTSHPLASLHGWDAVRQVQLRLTGRTALHVSGSIADAAWAALKPRSRATYAVQPGPGSICASPEDVSQVSEAEGRAVFCAVVLTYDTLEYLHFGKDGHERALFTWQGGALASEWLVP